MEEQKEFMKGIDHRFNRIYGQIKAIQKNIHEHPEVSCKDVIYQIKATRKALKRISDIFLEQKINLCVDVNKKEYHHLKEALEILSKEY